MPLSTVHSNSLLYFHVFFCETHDEVWEIISVSEKRMKNCIVKIIDNVFEKNDEGGLFPLKGQFSFGSNQRLLVIPSVCRDRQRPCDDCLAGQSRPEDIKLTT